MNKQNLKKSTAAFVAAGLLFATAGAASADVEAAKSDCIVGEQIDGYLGVIDESAADENLRREVRSINQQRKAVYAQLAQRNGVTIEVTAALTAEKLINQASSGHCVQDESASWVQTP